MSDETIDRLVADLRPVGRALSPVVQALVWSVAAAACIVELITLRYHCRADLAYALERPSYVLGVLCLALIAIGSAIAAIQSSFPGRRVSRAWSRAIVLLSLVYVGNLVVSAIDFPWREDLTVGLSSLGFQCSLTLLALSVTPALILVLGCRRLASVQPKGTGLWLSVAFASAAACGLGLICPLDAPVHHLVWHGIPVIALALLGRGVGPRLLHW